MKTTFLILLTLVFSQFLYAEFGPRNPVARLTMVAADSARWFLHRALDMVE
jgi:hypothetical protein